MKRLSVLENNRGSILVGAVALSILMAIAGMGFLMVSANNISSETTAFENEKAFQAAESGICIGARWLRDPTHNFLNTPDGTTLNPFGAPVLINGLNVVVTIPVQVGANGIPVASIVANVYNGTPGAAAFKKRISVGNVTNQGFGVYCTFYDGYQPVDAGDWVGGAWLNNWGGWGNNRNFYGRTHVNSMPLVLNNNQPRFFGPVTVSKNVTAGLGAGFANGQRGNDYSAGVVGALQNSGLGYSPPADLNDLNAIFTDSYKPNVDPVALNIPQTNATGLNAVLPVTQRINLPQSNRDEGYGPGQYRPTLYFNGQSAYYQYVNGAGVYRVQSYGAVVGGSINGMTFVTLNNNLNVYSTANGVTGNVTVATAVGNSIVPVGNLTTSDYSFASGTVPSNSNNMIGLISGGYIAFNKTWTKRFAVDALHPVADPGDVLKFVSEQVSGGSNNDPPGARTPAAVGMLHMTASIIAVCQFNDNTLWDGVAGFPNYLMSGTEWWDGMWGQLNPTPTPGNPPNCLPFNNPANRAEDYGFQLYGNHILRAYSRSIFGIACRGSQGTINFKPDPRMINRNLQPPGFPGVSNSETGGNLLTLVMRNWGEANTYSP